MTLAYDIVVSSVLLLMAIIAHLMAVELFAPGTALHAAASTADNLGGAEKADLWYQIFVMWIPLLVAGTAFAWPFVRAYRRQGVSAAQTVRR